MYKIIGETIGDGQERLIKEIILSGIDQPTKHGITLEYPETVSLEILHPFKNPILSKASTTSLKKMEIYANQLFNPRNPGFDYNCGHRWFNWNDKFNQIWNVVDELRKDFTSRRAIVSSYIPDIDSKLKSIPCISMLQFLNRNDKLYMKVVMRSSDALMALDSDLYGFSRILHYVSENIIIPPGSIEVIIFSSHIYYKRDEDSLKKYRQLLNI